MKRVILAVICAVFVFGTIATGYAEQGDWRGGIRSRIQASKQKIDQGIEQGTLNRKDRMKADGRISQGERDRINRDLDRLDRDIFKEKHDDNRNRGYDRDRR